LKTWSFVEKTFEMSAGCVENLALDGFFLSFTHREEKRGVRWGRGKLQKTVQQQYPKPATAVQRCRLSLCSHHKVRGEEKEGERLEDEFLRPPPANPSTSYCFLQPLQEMLVHTQQPRFVFSLTLSHSVFFKR
jgi:hypothetical protein